MQSQAQQDPLYRITASLILIIALGWLLYVGSAILAPLAFSLLLSMLLLPLCRRLERWKWPRSAAILTCILLIFIVLAGMIWFFTSQAMSFRDTIPDIQRRGTELLTQLQEWIEQQFQVKADEQIEYLQKQGNSLAGEGGAIITGITGFTGDLFTVLGLMPIYIFFILYFRNFFMEFLCRLFAKEDGKRIHKVVLQIENVSQSYLVGLVTVIAIVATLNTIGLMILGIDHAIFFGVMASVLAVIPYIGIAIGSILPALIALVTKDSAWYAVGVIGVMAFVQFLEGNFITPNIVGSQVAVNSFAAVLALLVAGALWGPAGMILAIPFTAILKVIFDNVEGLKPWGYVIGEPPQNVSLGRESGIGEAVDDLREKVGLPPSEDDRPETGNDKNVDGKSEQEIRKPKKD